ncbi:MAG TPA: helix-turn-helix domain-containing protein [Nocardioidaceae bacterium]|nr:helix-turn-helix domain-containing protein [Nocardioidaceae bacterium]
MSSPAADLDSRTWHIYRLLDRTRNAAELAQLTGLPESAVRGHIATLSAHKLITRRAGSGASAAYRRSASPSPEVLAAAEAAAARHRRGDRPDPGERPSQPSHDDTGGPPLWRAGVAPVEDPHGSAHLHGSPPPRVTADARQSPKAPDRQRSRAGIAAIALLAVLGGGALVWTLIDDDDGEARPSGEGIAAAESTRGVTGTPTEAPPATPSEDNAPTASSNAESRPDITLTSVPRTASPFETIPITGKYVRATEGVPLRLQHRSDGRWLTFPLPAVTDSAGKFRTYVELGSSGDHQLRVMDPRTQTVSPPVSISVG